MGFAGTVVDVLGNSHFEGWVAGPLVGAVAGVAFAAIAKPRDDGGDKSKVRERDRRTASTAGDSKSTLPVREVHHHHYHSGRHPGGGDDAAVPMFFLIGLVMSVSLLFFAAYLPTLAWALYFGITSVAMFCFTTLLIMLLSGQYRLSEHMNGAVLPLIFSACCLYVAVLARQNIGDEVVAYAQNTLGTGPLSMSRVISAAIAFLKAIGSDYALWMFFKMLAFVLVTISALVAFGKSLNFVASVNVSASGAWAWRFLEGRTRWVSGAGGTVALTFLLVAGALFGDGMVFEWTRQAQR